MSSERRKRLLILALFLLPVAILALLFKEIARTVVVLPLMYLVWLAGVLWRFIPQELFWGIFVIAALRVAIGSLSARRRRREAQLNPQQAASWGRARIWARWVELAGQGGDGAPGHEKRSPTDDIRGALSRLSPEVRYFRRRLARYLADLTMDALAQRERLPREQVQEELAAGRLDLPPRIRAHLLAVMNEPPPGRLVRLKQLFRGRPAAAYASPEEIVAFLEAQPGVGYGR